jgi:2-succinyl-5-enolpyruvyl-6-hydroxy-3-cyclohexene-1-carboxylate synthase
MQQSIQSILTQVLTIINYPEDKRQAFIIEFGDMCISKALASVTQPLSEEKKAELVNKIKDIEDPNEAEKIIGEYVSIDDYQKTIEQTTSELFENFLETIEQDLSEEQADALDTYLASLENKHEESSQQSETE